MLLNNLKNLTVSAALILFLTSAVIFAQPQKSRGVTVKPGPAAVPAKTPPPAIVAASVSQTSKRKSLVVLDFNDVSLTADSVKRPIGRQLAVLLTAEFAKRGNYSVISQHDKEIAAARVDSQKTGKDQTYASKIGKVLSANIVVFGDIIEYTIVSETKDMYYKKQITNTAKVGFTLTLVDVNTNEVKDGVTIDYIATSKDSNFGVYNTNKPLTEDQRITMLTEASKMGVIKAVDKLDSMIVPNSAVAVAAPPKPAENTVASPVPSNNLAETPAAPAGTGENKEKESGGGMFGFLKKKPKKTPENKPGAANTASTAVSAAALTNLPRIANVDGQDVYVKNLPAETKVGTKLIAYQIGKVIKDEATGDIIKQEELKVGELEVTSIENGIYFCRIVSGTGLTTKTLIKVAK